jgi:hypothetical protein
VLAGVNPDGTEDRLGGREVELGQVEIGAPSVHADFHVVSGTCLLRCWFTRPRLGGRLNQSKTPTSEASSINYSRLKRRASALRIAGLSGAGGAEMNNEGAKTRS